MQRQAGAAVVLLPPGHRAVVLEARVRDEGQRLGRHPQHGVDVLERVDAPDRDHGPRARGERRLRRWAQPVVEHEDLGRVDAEPHLPVRVGVGHRRDHVGRLVGHAREAAGQARRGEARAGRIAVARGGQVGLAHVDAVLGEDHRRAVQRLVDDRGDRRPSGRRHVQDVGVRRRGGRGPRHPVERLVQPRCLDEVERRRRAGLGRALGEDFAQGIEEGGPPAVGAKDAPHARRDGAGTRSRPPRSPRRRPPSRRDGAPGRRAGPRRRGAPSAAGARPWAAPRTTPRCARPRGACSGSSKVGGRPSGATIGSTCQSNPVRLLTSRSHHELTPPMV